MQDPIAHDFATGESCTVEIGGEYFTDIISLVFEPTGKLKGVDAAPSELRIRMARFIRENSQADRRRSGFQKLLISTRISIQCLDNATRGECQWLQILLSLRNRPTATADHENIKM
jgi:hypothetical protein